MNKLKTQAYRAVDYNLMHNYIKMFLLFDMQIWRLEVFHLAYT